MNDHRGPMRVGILTVLLFMSFGTAFAETVHLRRGTLDFESVLVGDGPVHLEGGRHFSFDGFAQSAFMRSADCGFECAPRETVDLGMTVEGNDLEGVVEMAGSTYPDVGGPISPSSMSITISGIGFAPRVQRAEVVKKSFPVMLVGQFIHYESVPLAPVIENLTARARAIVTWTKYEADSWSISHLSYKIGS